MITKSIISVKNFKWDYCRQWNSFHRFYHRAVDSRAFYNVTDITQSSKDHRNILLCQTQNHKLLRNDFKNMTFPRNTRTFSTSAQSLSIADKIQAFYNYLEKSDTRLAAFTKQFSAARFVDAAPKQWQPYLRLSRVDKPIGTWLLYLPCAFSISLAAPLGSLPSLYYLSLFGVGAFLMRGSGCIINDLWDQKIDKQVARTRERPLASGELKPKNAIALLAAQLSLSLGILLSLNTTCIMIGVAAMLPVILYPLAKRVTYFPQVVLGLTFNMGAIMGYAAVTGSFNWVVVLPLYLGCFFWTLYYDTIYAMQDRIDDAKVGVMSLALLFSSDNVRDREKFMKMSPGERLSELDSDKKRLVGFLAIMNLLANGMWITSAYCAGATYPAFIVPLIQMMRITRADHGVEDHQSYGESFLKSRNVGLAVLISFILGMLLAHPKNRTHADIEKK